MKVNRGRITAGYRRRIKVVVGETLGEEQEVAEEEGEEGEREGEILDANERKWQ